MIIAQNYTPRNKVSMIIFLNIQLVDVYTEREIWTHMKELANHKAGHIHGLKLEFLK